VKIWQKILLGFLLVFVLISLSAFPISWYYGRILEDFLTVVDRDFTTVDTVEDMEKLLLEMNSAVQHYQLTHTPSSLKKFHDEKRRWLVLKGQLSELNKTDLTISQTFIKMENATESWIQNRERTLGTKNLTDQDEELDHLRLLYREALSRLRERLSQSHEHAMKTVETSSNVAWALRTIALVIGLLTCFVVIRSVKKPLDRLMSATESISAGRFESLSPISKDEFGQLTQAFNEMSFSLRERTAALEEQRRLAIQANTLKTEFLANTSHELRTPLNSIMGYSQLLLDGLARNKEEEKSYLSIVQQSSKHLLALINDLLDIARIESGQMKLELSPVSVRDVFAQVEKHLNLQAQEKGLQLVIQPVPPGLYVRAHPGRLNQILLNLAGNSVKFTHSGTVEIKAEPNNGQVRFTVRDTGIGIALENQSKLFQKFVQADGSMTRQYGGTGLGLSLSKTLLELMGGKIELASEGEGKGTTATFVLPSEFLPA
jgi:signal transduction histidine kinase